ncbi:AbrB/MazE/SpoVT family DNA-binding domain-containing protein [archaeon]|jgi:AbrB family looped-hinge helix DNA binding protein|nr:AbrB/MazE/SpoVT family DNA-binding domain-containing protein [archaeon]MBT4397824.1 AbrB/MazE/SpoVT family DNA-binding domain-containing protein [archaeon]MBT4441158.1 AbrB/MazE/SpoVT family DNA-binding domain-containing protein [archaeon]
MDIATTKMSSKGQIVIPVEMREGIKEGEKLVIIRNNNQIIIEKVDQIRKSLEKDIARAKKVDKLVQNYETGKGKWVEMEFDDFVEEMKKW